MKKNILITTVALILIATMLTTTISNAFAFSNINSSNLLTVYQSLINNDFEGVSSRFTIRPLGYYEKGTELDWTLWSQEKLERYWYETRVPKREITVELMIELNRELYSVGFPSLFNYIDYEYFTSENISEVQYFLDNSDLNFNNYDFELRKRIAPLFIPEYSSYHQGLVGRLSVWDTVPPWHIQNSARDIGHSAISEANQIYPNYNQWMRHDAFRHFTWSLRLARDIGAFHTRIITNNYEYASIMLSDYLAYLNRVLESFLIIPGITYGEARLIAETAAFSFALSERRRLASYAAISNAHFQRTFRYDHIMDFWNNWRGFSFWNPELPHIEAFYQEDGNGTLILGECSRHVNHRVNQLRVSGQWVHFVY
ncbi:MAG: hypothetical protein FWF50_01420 [Defluviitaleaceae bacterium]|nr:hypothetical protein [Defluviitaleaceae bacterium]